MHQDSRIADEIFRGVLRCNAYGRWPQFEQIESPTIPFGNLVEGVGYSGYFNVSVFTYDEAPDPVARAQVESKGTSRKIWRGSSPTVFHIGDRFYTPPLENFSFKPELEHAKKGEIDIVVAFDAMIAVEPSEVRQLTKAIAYHTLASINAAIDELVTPAAPFALIRKRKGGPANQDLNFSAFVKKRPGHDKDKVKELLAKSIRVRTALTGLEAQYAQDAALRRYCDGLAEPDPIDKLCDFWEACEFLVVGVKAKGGLVSKIATALSQHSGENKQLLERRLRIQDVYRSRKDVVHNAVSEPAKFQDNLAVLECITTELVRKSVGLSYDPDTSGIARLLASAPVSGKEDYGRSRTE